MIGIVLIESDWNLKYDVSSSLIQNGSVLIESDWNLKFKKQLHLLNF